MRKLVTDFQEILTLIERLEVLNDIYEDYIKGNYETKEQIEIAKLKMKLTKKQMLMLLYILNKKIEAIKVL